VTLVSPAPSRRRPGGRRPSYSAGMLAILAADRPWSEIPGVGLVGGILGIMIIIVAIRYMFKKK
jgi:hypothetical protein